MPTPVKIWTTHINNVLLELDEWLVPLSKIAPITEEFQYVLDLLPDENKALKQYKKAWREYTEVIGRYLVMGVEYEGYVPNFKVRQKVIAAQAMYAAMMRLQFDAILVGVMEQPE